MNFSFEMVRERVEGQNNRKEDGGRFYREDAKGATEMGGD